MPLVILRGDLHHVRGKIANLIEGVPGGHLQRHLSRTFGMRIVTPKMCLSGWESETV